MCQSRLEGRRSDGSEDDECSLTSPRGVPLVFQARDRLRNVINSIVEVEDSAASGSGGGDVASQVTKETTWFDNRIDVQKANSGANFLLCTIQSPRSLQPAVAASALLCSR